MMKKMISFALVITCASQLMFAEVSSQVDNQEVAEEVGGQSIHSYKKQIFIGCSIALLAAVATLGFYGKKNEMVDHSIQTEPLTAMGNIKAGFGYFMVGSGMMLENVKKGCAKGLRSAKVAYGRVKKNYDEDLDFIKKTWAKYQPKTT